VYLVTSHKLIEDSKPEWKANEAFYEGHVRKMIAAEVWLLQHADRVLASTNQILHDTERSYGTEIDRRKVTVLPFGVPGPIEPGHRDRAEDDTLRLLFVGRFEIRKGVDLLLDVLPGLLERFPRLQATLIGDHASSEIDGRSYDSWLIAKRAAAEWAGRIRFLGHVDEAALEQAYAECDLFVAPSRYESFGLMYLEAMRYGKPCIGTTAGGIPEVVVHGETGLLIAPDDKEGLRDAIEKLVADDDLRTLLGENGRRRYQEHFTTAKFAEGFESLVRGWIAESHPVG
jgi:glycosyltransferase involved in cell wall biosynthesis